MQTVVNNENFDKERILNYEKTPCTGVNRKRFFGANSYAQFGGLLKDLKTLSDKVQAQGTPRIDTPEQLPNNNQSQNATGTNTANRAQLDANTYCDRIKSSSVLNEYAAVIDDLVSVNGQQSRTIYRGLDNDNFDLTNAIKELKIPDQVWNNRESILRTIGFFADCGAMLKDDKLIRVILPLVKGNDLNDFHNLKTTEARTKFLMQQYGDPNPTFPNVLNHPSLKDTSFKGSENRYWITLFSIAFKGAYDKIPAISKSSINDLNIALSERRDFLKKSDQEEAAKREEIKERQLKAEKNKLELEEKNKKEQAFASTPDGQLTIAYQNFQIVQLCYDLRKDFSVKFIGPSDYQDYRSKIKKIEQALEKKTKEKDTNKLYALAEQRNRSFNIAAGLANIERDIIEMITDNSKGSNWMTAKDDCNLFATRLRSNADEILGKESMKKNF